MSHTNLFQGQSDGPGIGSGDLGGFASIGGLLASFIFGPEVGLPLLGSGLDLFQAQNRNQRTDDILGAFLPEISQATQGLQSAANQPVLTQNQIRQGIGRPGTAANDIIQRLLPELQQAAGLTGVTTDLDSFGGAIGQQVGGAQSAAQQILSPDALRGALEPIRQQREQVLQGGRIDDPLQLGRDIISEVGGFGTPQTQFGIASESAARLARQNTAGLGNLEETKATRGVAERAARLPIAAQAELSKQRSDQAEAALLQASGLQGQQLNQRLTELEAGGFDRISDTVSAGRLQLPGVLANLAGTGTQGLLGLLQGSLSKDQLQSAIESLGFNNQLQLAGLESGAASAAEQDETNLLNVLLGQGNIDRNLSVGAEQTEIQALLNQLGISLGRPDVLVPIGQQLTTAAQQHAANKAAEEAADTSFFDFGGAGQGIGTGVGAFFGGLPGALVGSAVGGSGGNTLNQFFR